jgi:hypothetical protein
VGEDSIGHALNDHPEWEVSGLDKLCSNSPPRTLQLLLSKDASCCSRSTLIKASSSHPNASDVNSVAAVGDAKLCARPANVNRQQPAGAPEHWDSALP